MNGMEKIFEVANIVRLSSHIDLFTAYNWAVELEPGWEETPKMELEAAEETSPKAKAHKTSQPQKSKVYNKAMLLKDKSKKGRNKSYVHHRWAQVDRFKGCFDAPIAHKRDQQKGDIALKEAMKIQPNKTRISKHPALEFNPYEFRSIEECLYVVLNELSKDMDMSDSDINKIIDFVTYRYNDFWGIIWEYQESIEELQQKLEDVRNEEEDTIWRINAIKKHITNLLG